MRDALATIVIDQADWDDMARDDQSVAWRDALGVALVSSGSELIEAMVGRSGAGAVSWEVTVRDESGGIATIPVSVGDRAPLSISALELVLGQLVAGMRRGPAR